MEWSRNPASESRMASLGVQWSVRDIPIKAIDTARSLANQARLVDGSLNNDLVLEYGVAMSEVDTTFEMIIVRELGNGKYCIVDGNHRLQGFLLSDASEGKKAITAYVITSDDAAKVELMVRTWNYSNGLRPSAVERKKQVAQFRLHYPGIPDKILAKHFCLKLETVTAWGRETDTHQTLEKEGLSIPPGATAALVSLRGDTDVLKHAARAVIAHGLTLAQTEDLVRATKARRTAKSKCEAIDEHIRALGTPVRERGAYNPHKIRDGFRQMVARMIAYLNQYPTYEHLQLTAEADFRDCEYHVGILVEKLMGALSYAKAKQHRAANGKATKRTAKVR